MTFDALGRAPRGDMKMYATKMSAIRVIKYHHRFNFSVLGSSEGDLVSFRGCSVSLKRAGDRIARLQPKDQMRCFAGRSDEDLTLVTDKNRNSTVLTLPTILTLARVVAIPALMASWFCEWWTACAVIFLGASITDFFDGYLARKLNCSSPFGAFLDPVADKLMVATILILLSTVSIPYGFLAGNTWIVPATSCVIIAREITMSALREWGASLGPEAHQAVAVNALGKYKTTSQMASLVLLLMVRTPWMRQFPDSISMLATDAGMLLLFIAALLTVSSLVSYFKALWRFMV